METNGIGVPPSMSLPMQYYWPGLSPANGSGVNWFKAINHGQHLTQECQPLGKDRRFYVTIGNHLSSSDYREAQLRGRRIDLASYVDDPAFQWAWSSERDFQRYRDLRGDAESWGQRRGSFIAALVANRLIASVSALLTARREREKTLHIGVTPGPTLKLALAL